MPTKSNNIGGRGGARPGAGRKKTAVREKAENGNPGGRRLEVLDIPEVEGVDMPKPHDFLSAEQRDGSTLQASEIYGETWEWLKKIGCASKISPQLLERYAMCSARWIQCEEMTNRMGFLQNHADWNYCGVYSDEAITGTKSDRPGFQRMLKDCEAGKIYLILTKSISRFSRNTVTFLQTIRKLKSIGIDVFFEEQNIHSIDGSGELMTTILSSFAQEESHSVSQNMKWRIKKNFEEGIPWNNALLGYRLKGDRYELIPEEADTVRRIFREYLSGFGKTKIANSLTADGIPTRFGGPWHPNTVGKILRNETYTGNLLLQKTFIEDHITKKKRINNGERPKYLVESSHEAIIPPRNI